MTGPRLRYLDIRGLTTIHRELAARYGGGCKEPDEATLHLVLVRSEMMVRDPHWKRRARLAAEYGWRMLTIRPFAEGNERMALAAMVTYLEMNGFTWNCGEVEETAMVQRAAAKGMKEDEWEAWVIRNVGKKG
jgi:death on curing protein